MAQHNLTDGGGYDDKWGFIRCPLCGGYTHNVVYQDFDGAWTFARVDVGLCDDGFRGVGKHQCKKDAQKRVSKGEGVYV